MESRERLQPYLVPLPVLVLALVQPPLSLPQWSTWHPYLRHPLPSPMAVAGATETVLVAQGCHLAIPQPLATTKPREKSHQQSNCTLEICHIVQRLVNFSSTFAVCTDETISWNVISPRNAIRPDHEALDSSLCRRRLQPRLWIPVRSIRSATGCSRWHRAIQPAAAGILAVRPRVR